MLTNEQITSVKEEAFSETEEPTASQAESLRSQDFLLPLSFTLLRNAPKNSVTER